MSRGHLIMDTLQVSQLSKGASRSQSPSTTDLARSDPSMTDDAVIRSRVQSPSTMHVEPSSSSATSSRHGGGGERLKGHSKSHSRDLGSFSTTTSRELEDSPQKKILAGVLSASDYGSPLYTPNMSLDDYGTPNVYRGQTVDSDYSGQGDDTDACSSQAGSRAADAIAHLNNKISRTKELIRSEQTLRDENVNEYLKLAANADKQQLQRIKAVFEKKNQKSAHCIAQLQKKLESYNKRIKNWETHGTSTGHGSHRQPREVLRDMGQGLKNVGGNIRDGISGLGGSVMAAPREFAHLFTRSNRFGSADNISSMAQSTETEVVRANASSEGSRASETVPEERGANTLPRAAADVITAANQVHAAHELKYTPDDASPCSSVTSESCGFQNQGGSNNMSDVAFSLKPILNELRERKEDYERLCDRIDTIKNLTQEVQFLSNALQEERFRTERLEEQINDLTELHQNEVENLKQALTDVEEKVQYQSEERLRDIHEALDLCQTKITKLEQSGASMSGGTGAGEGPLPPRLLLVKLLNVAITLLQLVLLLVATVAGITMPFLRTRVRVISTTIFLILLIAVLKQWPEVTLLSEHLALKLRRYLTDNAPS